MLNVIYTHHKIKLSLPHFSSFLPPSLSLSLSLSLFLRLSVIPRLVEAGSDAHPKGKESARAARVDISSVIRNPEVARLSPVLLAALGDPANKTKQALDALMDCEFMHSIDAPSLGLLVPILGRALRDRGADLKRKSAVITGNMCSMISDQSVLIPYLPQVSFIKFPSLSSVYFFYCFNLSFIKYMLLIFPNIHINTCMHACMCV